MMIITTIPKSGTYLIKAILEHAGLTCDARHLTQGGMATVAEGADFRVGHLWYCKTDYKVVFLHRDLRDAFLSSIRYSMQRGSRKQEPLTSNLICRALQAVPRPPKMAAFMPWLDKADLVLGFKDLTFTDPIRRIIRMAGGDERRTALAIECAFNKPTTTWSGDKRRTTHQDYWDASIQAAWEVSPLIDYNIQLGYE